MKQRIKFLQPLIIATTLVIGMLIGYKVAQDIPGAGYFFRSQQKNSLEQALSLIENRYVDSVDSDKLSEKVLQSALKELDPFSIYIPPGHAQDVREQLQGNFQGIGVEYTIVRDTPVVLRCIPNGPSEKSGIQAGDQLLKADTHSLVKEKQEDIARFIKGPAQSPVILAIQRQQEKKSITIIRDKIDLPSSNVAYLLGDSIGYIKLLRFSTPSHRELAQEIEQLQARGMRHLIFDLRDNRGGLLESAIAIADEFLPEKKLVVYTENERKSKQEFYTKRRGLFETGRLVVLLNESSASASEVVAGALQDWDRAAIIGSISYGKGLVQEQYNLPNNGLLRLTVARYFTPSGRCIQKNYLSKQQLKEQLIHYNQRYLKTDTFKTAAGRIVASNGGIAPDITVQDAALFPIKDTVQFMRAITHTRTHEWLITQFVRQMSLWKKYKNPKDFYEHFQFASQDIRTLLHTLKLPQHNALINSVQQKLKINLMRLIWPDAALQPFLNTLDPVFQKALHYIRTSSSLS